MRPPIRPSTARARRGAILPFVCVLLTVLIGAAALAVDLGRVYLTGSEAQAGADAAAIAGARFLQQYSAYYNSYITTNYGIGAVTAANRVAGAGTQVVSVQPVTYDPSTNTVSPSSWTGSTSAVTVTVQATPKYVFAGALGIAAPTVTRKATAWIASVNGAGCVRPFALPYTRFYEEGMHRPHQDSVWTQSGGGPDYTYFSITTLQPDQYNNTPPGRTYVALPQWVPERWVDSVNAGSNGKGVSGRWFAVDFAGGGVPRFQSFVAAAPNSPGCQQATAQVGVPEQPLMPYAKGLPMNTGMSASPAVTPDTAQRSLLNAMRSAMTQLCHRTGNAPDARCYNADGTVGVRARVFLADSAPGGPSGFVLGTREVTMVRIMCYFQGTNDVCAPAYIADQSHPAAATSYWRLPTSATSGYPEGTIAVLLDGPTNIDVTPDLVYGNKPGITQRVFLVR